MRFHPWKQIRFGALFVTAAALAAQQSPPSPKFEVVSIQQVSPNAPPLMREQGFTAVLPGGQYIDSRTTLPFLITFAYDVKNPSTQLLGLPRWAMEQGYSVAANPPVGFPLIAPAENREQVRLMMQSMLADRFHLKLRVETRPAPIFKLEVARGGIKIKEVNPPVPPEKEGPVQAAMNDRRGRMIGQKSTMDGMARALTVFLKRPVVDETGLKGYYDFDVRWDEPADDRPAGASFGTEGTALLISALQDKFGLRLTNSTGQTQFWIVDHVEPPTEN